LDIGDLRRHTIYHGYKDRDPYICEFWRIIHEELSKEERELFLSFVTGCTRPPLLGFKYLSPQFCVHQVVLDAGQQRLPTASTCMNMLKLPHYGGDFGRLRESIKIAINSGAGFNLE